MIRSAIISITVLFAFQITETSEILRIAVPRGNEIAFYRSNHDAEEAEGSLEANGRYVILDTEHADLAKILLSDDKPAYVRKEDIVVVSASARFGFGDLEATGYVENPDAIIIAGNSRRSILPLRLDRSFRESILENLDSYGFRASAAMGDAE